jgi:hypothetical protein
MWLFTKYGFFSAVCARQGDGKHGRPVDPNRIMVRARARDHLERLKKRFASDLGGCEVRETTSTDYRFRLFVDKQVWSNVVQRITAEVDYDNFKSEVARFQGKSGKDYEHALHDVWSVMLRLQDGE